MNPKDAKNALITCDWLYFVEPLLLPILVRFPADWNQYVRWRRGRYIKMLDQKTNEMIPLIEKMGYDVTPIRKALGNGAIETAYRLTSVIIQEIKKKKKES